MLLLGSIVGSQMVVASNGAEAESLLGSLETASELELWATRAVSAALSTENVTDVERSVHLVFGTDDGFPSFRLYLEREPALPVDWSGYKYLEFDVWNA